MKAMLQKVVWTAALAAAVCLVSNPASAQSTDTANVTVTVHVNAKAKLTITGGPVVFADADPTSVPTLTSNTLTIDVKARTTKTGSVDLEALASGDLTNGAGDTITIGNLTWTVTGTGYAAGTMATSNTQVGAWSGSGSQSGTQTFSLPNSWTYNTGDYSSTVTYTLTAP